MSIVQSVREGYFGISQKILYGLDKVRHYRNNTDIFQKVCQIAVAILDLMKSTSLSVHKFSATLAVVSIHDFFRFLKLPQRLLCPITAEKIDEDEVVENLSYHIHNLNGNSFFKSSIGKKEYSQYGLNPMVINGEVTIDNILKVCLKEHLKQMEEHNHAYQNIDDFLEALKERLSKKIEVKGVFEWKEVNVQAIKEERCNDPIQWIKHVTLIDKIINWNWLAADIGCIGLFLKGWNFLDTAKWANRIGQYSVFRWVKNQTLETFMLKLACVGSTLKIFESIRKLRDDKLNEQQEKNVRWNILTSVADLAFYGTVYFNQTAKTTIPHSIIQILAIITKALGIYSNIRSHK